MRGVACAACFAVSLLLTLATSIAARGQVEITISGTGTIKNTAKVQNGILGTVGSLKRSGGIARECVGACFYATKTRTKTWICREFDCDLDCSGREPVGGCL